MLGFVEEAGRISETVFWSFETAAAQAESFRLDVVIDLVGTACCGRIAQKGQMNGLNALDWDVNVLVPPLRRARPPAPI